MKFTLLLLITLALHAEVQLAPDGTYVVGTPQLTPSGDYVGSGDVVLTPSGDYVAVPEQPEESPYDYYNPNNEEY